MNTELLRRVPIFSELPEDQLESLHASSDEINLKAGEILVEEGSPPGPVWAILEGTFEVTKRAEEEDIVLSLRRAGDLVGEMAVLEQVPRTATVRAIEDSRVLRIGQEEFFEVLAKNPPAMKAVLNLLAFNLRNTERLLVHNSKMASLGTLAAGLAHELNNPAAAVARSSRQLRDALEYWQYWTARLNRFAFDEAQLSYLDALREDETKKEESPQVLDSLERSDREENIQTWLEERQIDDSWELAHMLASSGWEPAALDRLALVFALEQLVVVIPWIAHAGSTYALLAEVSTGASRISEVVDAVRHYSYLDEAPVQQIDVTRGLEDTLLILAYKLTPGITIKRDYARDLPKIEAYASELNQVWTNIIENALDAMDGNGVLGLRAYVAGKNVVVEISDNGPGIPPDAQKQIFDPFFTTKPQEFGMGLGLHIAYNIVVEKHQGRIEFSSRPGKTVFKVTLPVELLRKESWGE